ncbi:hypothetical protein BD779DRAFT_1783333 [Infundibulicybe gibba]|nr:hypothetical protein BD779DRAFT_1783333 [Infundibulicybe gibba]
MAPIWPRDEFTYPVEIPNLDSPRSYSGRPTNGLTGSFQITKINNNIFWNRDLNIVRHTSPRHSRVEASATSRGRAPQVKRVGTGRRREVVMGMWEDAHMRAETSGDGEETRGRGVIAWVNVTVGGGVGGDSANSGKGEGHVGSTTVVEEEDLAIALNNTATAAQ